MSSLTLFIILPFAITMPYSNYLNSVGSELQDETPGHTEDTGYSRPPVDQALALNPSQKFPKQNSPFLRPWNPRSLRPKPQNGLQSKRRKPQIPIRYIILKQIETSQTVPTHPIPKPRIPAHLLHKYRPKRLPQLSYLTNASTPS